VKNGGGLFVTVTPWGWIQIKNSKHFSLTLTYKTLPEAGIVFTENYISSDTINFSHKTHLSHLAIKVDIAPVPENPSFNYNETMFVFEQAQLTLTLWPDTYTVATLL
jgi:hypothetical protein